MSDKDKSGAGSVLEKLGLRPITKCSIAKFYVPAVGVASYTALSINVMNPRLTVRWFYPRVFPNKDITNILLGSALVGTGIYFYTRDHMARAPTPMRITYSATGAVLFSFGSVLYWAVLRSVIPPNPVVCTIAGIGSSLLAITVCQKYLNFVDDKPMSKS